MLVSVIVDPRYHTATQNEKALEPGSAAVDSQESGQFIVRPPPTRPLPTPAETPSRRQIGRNIAVRLEVGRPMTATLQYLLEGDAVLEGVPRRGDPGTASDGSDVVEPFGFAQDTAGQCR